MLAAPVVADAASLLRRLGDLTWVVSSSVLCRESEQVLQQVPACCVMRWQCCVEVLLCWLGVLVRCEDWQSISVAH